MAEVELVLYVTGKGPLARKAMADVEQLRAEHLGDEAELTVIDTVAQGEQAAAAKVRVTPTLIKRRPPPERRVVGDLAEARRVLAALGLVARGKG